MLDFLLLAKVFQHRTKWVGKAFISLQTLVGQNSKNIGKC